MLLSTVGTETNGNGATVSMAYKVPVNSYVVSVVTVKSLLPMSLDEILFLSSFGTLVSSKRLSDIVAKLTNSSYCL